MMMMKNAVPMVTMAESAAKCSDMHTHMDHTHSITHLRQRSYNHVVRKAPAQLLQNLKLNFILKVPEGLGSKLEYPEKKNRQPAR